MFDYFNELAAIFSATFVEHSVTSSPSVLLHISR